VQGEKVRVLTHGALATSPWLRVPIDYSAMSPRGQADRDDAHAALFRAMAWVDGATLALEGQGEDAVRAAVDVATARTHARAALLLSRLVEHDVDAEAASAWGRIARADDLLLGDSDDSSPRDIEAAAIEAKLDLRSSAWFADVAAVDRVRKAASRAKVAHIDDGAGGVRVPSIGWGPTGLLGALFPHFRLVGPRATPDAELLQSLVFPLVGASSSSAGAGTPVGDAGAPSTDPAAPADLRRTLPSGLDVAAWLGSREARLALRASGADAYAHYDATLDRQIAARPPRRSIDRHRTPYLSWLDALQSWLGPSVGDAVSPAALSPEWRARKADVSLAAWTELRHDSVALSRVHVPDVRMPDRVPGETQVPVFVEPHPEAIADLLALVRQTARALVADGAIAPDGAAAVTLGEVQDILWVALGVAVHEAADQAVPPAMTADLAAFPGRLRALEAALGEAGGASVPIVVDVHEDPAAGRVLEEGLGTVQEMWIAMRDPRTHKTWLALGASIPHVESIQPMALRRTDSTWAAALGDVARVPGASLDGAYVVPTP
jgi:hypothetical protein